MDCSVLNHVYWIEYRYLTLNYMLFLCVWWWLMLSNKISDSDSDSNSAEQLTLLPVVRNRPLCQAPPPWRHNAVPRWRHIQNITKFWNLAMDTLRDVKSTGKFWLNFAVLISRDKNKTVYLRDTDHQTPYHTATVLLSYYWDIYVRGHFFWTRI